MLVAAVSGQFSTQRGAISLYFMRKENIKAMFAADAFELADIHFFLVPEFVQNASLDVEKQALLVISHVTLTGADEGMTATVADGTFLAELVLDVEVHP